MIFSISFYLRKIFVFSFQLFEQSPADPLPSQPSKIFIFTFPYIILCNTLAQMPRDMRNYISRALNFHCQVSFSEHPSAFFERSAKPALILAERGCFDLFPVSLGLTAFAQLKLFDAAGIAGGFLYTNKPRAYKINPRRAQSGFICPAWISDRLQEKLPV